MNLIRQTKIAILVGIAAFLLTSYLISNSIQSQNYSHMMSPNSKDDSSCIYDPIHKLIKPGSDFLSSSKILTRVLTALDAFVIDFSICSLGLYYIITGRTSTFLPSIVMFYLIRTIALNIVTFPIPTVYFFEYPGFPSYFVDYDRVNDLYFSGHAGCLMIYIMDCLQNRRRKLLFAFVPFFIYTVIILLIEGIHYTNDIIIGVVFAMTVSRLNYIHRLRINLFLFQAIGVVFSPWERLLEEFRNKISVFQNKHQSRKKEIEKDMETLNAINEFN